MTVRRFAALGLILSAPLLVSASMPSRSSLSSSTAMETLAKAIRASGCGFMLQGEGSETGKSVTPMPLVDGLAPIHYPVTTQSTEAQRYFDQGLALLYGFEFEKAERSFKAASAADPACAMCLWGEALAIGPYINSGPSGVETITRAHALTVRALAMPGINERERALILALQARYAPKGPADQKGVHEVTFAEAMQAASDRWPDDDFIMVLAAEAAMNVRPWDYWEADNATPRPWAKRAIKLVETVLARNPAQPEAQHLYIHLTEASTTPGRAERAADMLLTAAPASAHLVHMPSHTYYRVGRFAESVRVNQQAIGVDEAMARTLKEDPKFYGYFGHHTHFILSAAEQVGDRTNALKAAADLEAFATPERAAKNGWLTARLATALQARAQFARGPAEMLTIPQPDARLPDMRMLWHTLRAESLGRAGRAPEAKTELAAMRQLRRKHRPGEEMQAMIELAELIARARIAEGQGDAKSAIKLLTKAAGIEHGFAYNEPPVWHQPVDAALGAVLLRTGDAKGAKAAFDRALVRRPGSAWVLWGKAQAETALGENAASAQSMTRYRQAWAGEQDSALMAQL